MSKYTALIFFQKIKFIQREHLEAFFQKWYRFFLEQERTLHNLNMSGILLGNIFSTERNHSCLENFRLRRLNLKKYIKISNPIFPSFQNYIFIFNFMCAYCIFS